MEPAADFAMRQARDAMATAHRVLIQASRDLDRFLDDNSWTSVTPEDVVPTSQACRLGDIMADLAFAQRELTRWYLMSEVASVTHAR